MQFNEQMLYILIEGTENSPEVTFIKKVIRQLVNAEKLPDIPSDLIENLCTLLLPYFREVRS